MKLDTTAKCRTCLCLQPVAGRHAPLHVESESLWAAEAAKLSSACTSKLASRCSRTVYSCHYQLARVYIDTTLKCPSHSSGFDVAEVSSCISPRNTFVVAKIFDIAVFDVAFFVMVMLMIAYECVSIIDDNDGDDDAIISFVLL